jgi:hypothetical protein
VTESWLFRHQFGEFVQRDPATGRVRFANRAPGGRHFLERCVPIFAQPRRRVRRRRKPIGRICDEKINRAINKSARLAAIRRWIPANPLDVHQMRVEDAFRRNCR